MRVQVRPHPPRRPDCRAARVAVSAVVTFAAGVASLAIGAPAHAAAAAGFHAVSPSRVLDTRSGIGTTGGRLEAGETREIQVAGLAGVPADAVAVALNVTLTEPTAASYLTVWPAGAARPLASNLNVIAGQTIANMVTVGLGDGGRLALYNNAGGVQAIVDVTGWYGSGFHPVAPLRLVDTRDGTGGTAAPLGAEEARSVAVATLAHLPAGAAAVALNVTVTEPSASGFVTVWPHGAPRPQASNLNFVPGQTVPNMVTVGLGDGGAVDIFNSWGATQVVVDLAGWFDGGFHALVPSRLVDTREGRCLARLGPGEMRLVAIAGLGGVPADGVEAVALNVTVTNATKATYVSVWPSDRIPAPGERTSNVNVVAGSVPNMVTVGLGPDGRVALFNNEGVVDVVVDVGGYYDGTVGAIHAVTSCDANGFAPQPPMPNLTAGGALQPLAPVGFRSGGDGVAAWQQRLSELGFWVAGINGRFDYATHQAIMAFQKSVGLPPSGTADELTALVAEMQTIQPSALSTSGDLVEVDKRRQLWFLVRNGQTVLTVNTSTGSDIPYTEVDQKNGGVTAGDAHTPEGVFKVYREYSDGWEHGQLGDLYRPRYFAGGAAVHGAPNVPNYPASHGCVRVSTQFMDHVWATDLMPHGSTVWVHN